MTAGRDSIDVRGADDDYDDDTMGNRYVGVYWLSYGALRWGCGERDARRGEATTRAGDLDLGERVFARNCASCHGRDGGAGVGPKLANGRVVERYPDPSDQRAIVVNGRERCRREATS